MTTIELKEAKNYNKPIPLTKQEKREIVNCLSKSFIQCDKKFKQYRCNRRKGHKGRCINVLGKSKIIFAISKTLAIWENAPIDKLVYYNPNTVFNYKLMSKSNMVIRREERKEMLLILEPISVAYIDHGVYIRQCNKVFVSENINYRCTRPRGHKGRCICSILNKDRKMKLEPIVYWICKKYNN